MTRRALTFSAVAAAIALAVALVGAALVPAEARRGVYVGAVIALVSQLFFFWLVAVWLFPGRAGLAYGLGMLGRMFVFGVVALVVVPKLALGVGPTLFSLVGVFWVTTMVEPLFLRTRTQTIS